MSKITIDDLTRSGTGYFIAVPIWQQWASKGYRTVSHTVVVELGRNSADLSRRPSSDVCRVRDSCPSTLSRLYSSLPYSKHTTRSVTWHTDWQLRSVLYTVVLL